MAGNFLGKVENPLTVDGLSFARPDPDETPLVVAQYDVTPKGGAASNPQGPWIWCSHCQKPTHWHGFVVQQSTGSRHLIGQDCARQHYGAERFDVAHRAYREIEKRGELLRRISKLKAAADEIIEEVRLTLTSDAYAEIKRKRAELHAACPDALLRLASSVLSGGLTTHETIVDVDGKSQAQLIPLGAVDGAELISGNFENAAQLAISLFESIQDLNASDQTNPQLTKILKEIGYSLKSLMEAREGLSAAANFFSERNLSRLQRWSIPHRARFSMNPANDGSLEIHDTKLGVRTIVPVKKARLPTMMTCKSVAQSI